MDEKQLSSDSTIIITVDDSFLTAQMAITKPMFDGKEATLDDVKNALRENSVFCSIDWDRINEYLRKKQYGTTVVVASGKPVVDGENGSISFTHDPTSNYKPKLDEETGTVNFRELGRVTNIKKGEIIAEIKLPTLGTPGMDIRGKEIMPMPGREVPYTLGAGTSLSDDKTKVLSAIDGNLRWDQDRFVVDAVVNVGGDVDVAIGNIDFVGDVVVKGNICEGYTVKGKNITVLHNVNKCNVIASGKLEIKGGAIFANLKVNEEIKMSFAENATIHCEGKIFSKSIVNCRIFSKDDITVSGSKGVIVGGEVVCCGNITATQIGSVNYAHTSINLGNAVDLMQEYTKSKEKYTKDYENYIKLQKLYNQLSVMKNSNIPLTDEQEQIRRQAFRFVMSEKPKLIDASKQLEYTEAMLNKAKTLKLMVKSKAYPGVNIRIFTSIYDLNDEYGNCTFFLGQDGEVSMRAGTA